jgi:hypothetical protein
VHRRYAPNHQCTWTRTTTSPCGRATTRHFGGCWSYRTFWPRYRPGSNGICTASPRSSPTMAHHCTARRTPPPHFFLGQIRLLEVILVPLGVRWVVRCVVLGRLRHHASQASCFTGRLSNRSCHSMLMRIKLNRECVGRRDCVGLVSLHELGESTETFKRMFTDNELFYKSFARYARAPRTTHRAPCTTHRAPCTVHHAPCTTHHAPRTVHHAPRTVHHAPCTTHHAPCTVHHALSTLVAGSVRRTVLKSTRPSCVLTAPQCRTTWVIVGTRARVVAVFAHAQSRQNTVRRHLFVQPPSPPPSPPPPPPPLTTTTTAMTIWFSAMVLQ